MAQNKLSWTAPIPKHALRTMLVGAAGGLASMALFAVTAIIVFTG